MRVGIDCREIYDVEGGAGAGIARYVFYLVNAILKRQRDDLQFVLFFDKNISVATLEKLRQSGSFEAIFIGRGVPIVGRHIYFPWIIKSSGVDRMIFPANVMPFFSFRRALVVVHDLAIYLRPEWFPRQWFSTNILVPWSLIKAEKIIAISQNTKKDILELFPNIDAEKVNVVYPAACLATRPIDNTENKEKYLIFVGTLEPRKNIVNLLLAFVDYLKETGDGLKLKLISAWGWKTEEIRCVLRRAQELAPGRIELLGALDDAKKAEVLAGARALLMPSFYEGFGLPVVEAMSLGVPVIAGKNSSLEEICGEAALLVDPYNVGEIKDAIKKILTEQDLVNDLIKRGRAVASDFDWDRSAAALLLLV